MVAALLVTCVVLQRSGRGNTKGELELDWQAMQDRVSFLAGQDRSEEDSASLPTLQDAPRPMDPADEYGWIDEEVHLEPPSHEHPSGVPLSLRPVSPTLSPGHPGELAPPSSAASPTTHLADLDASPAPPSCPPSGCRFLVAARIGEQESKAMQHLYQLGLLARSLNRTLVLPNVDRARFGSCQAHPFEFYYQADALERLGIQVSGSKRWRGTRATGH